MADHFVLILPILYNHFFLLLHRHAWHHISSARCLKEKFSSTSLSHKTALLLVQKYPGSRWVQTSRLVAHANSWKPSRWAELGLSWHIHTRTLTSTPGILWLQWLLPVSSLYRLTTCTRSYINWTTISSGGPCMFASLASSISSHLLFLEGPFSRATQILTAGTYPLSGFFLQKSMLWRFFFHWLEKLYVKCFNCYVHHSYSGIVQLQVCCLDLLCIPVPSS